jgi:hypothetical protein
MAADLEQPPTGPPDDRRPEAPRGRRTDASVDPKQIRLAAVLLFGAIIAGMVMFTAIADPGDPKEASTSQGIIPEPNSGRKPENLGDPGGWGQLALLGLVIVAVSGIGYVAIRGRSAKARAGRDAWMAAGASRHDGVLDEALDGGSPPPPERTNDQA